MSRFSWIIIIVTFIFCGLLIFFVGRPSVLSFLKTYGNIKTSRQELSDTVKEKTILEQYSKDANFAAIYGNASNYIPVAQNTGDLVIEATALANQNNLQVSSFSFDSGSSSSASTSTSSSSSSSSDTSSSTAASSTPSTPSSSSTSSSAPDEIKFSATLNGSFSDFLNFLKGVETGNRLISITSMTLSQTTTSFSVNITGKAYWKKDTSLSNTLANITVSQSVLDKFANLKTYGSPINLPAESGFGRSNPFSGY